MPLFGKKEESKRGFVPVDEVKGMILNKVPEGEIIEILRRGGFSAEEIARALAEAFRPVPSSLESRPLQLAKREPEVAKTEIPSKKSEETPNLEEEVPKELPKERAETRGESESASLFVKLDKYADVLKLLNDLKMSVNTMKDSFMIITELKSITDDSFKILQNMIENTTERLDSLDSRFVRPPGFKEEKATKSEIMSQEEIKDVLKSLKGQVDKLKNGLK